MVPPFYLRKNSIFVPRYLCEHYDIKQAFIIERQQILLDKHCRHGCGERMKIKICHIAVFFAIVALISSCKGNNDIYPSVQLEFVTGKTTDKGQLSAITTDKNKTYLVSKDRTNTVYETNKSIRIVANYAIETENGDSTADIYASAKAIATTPQAPDKFINGIKNDPAEVLSIWQGRNYLNIVLNVLAQSQAHTFAFIEQSATIESDGRYRVSLLLYHDNQQHPPRGLPDKREISISSKIEEQSTDKRSHNYHRMQTNQSAFKEILQRHSIPTVIIGIANDKTRKNEKEVNSQIAMSNGKSSVYLRCRCNIPTAILQHCIHATNIAEASIYSNSGENLRHNKTRGIQSGPESAE